jgi:hypothetical protein
MRLRVRVANLDFCGTAEVYVATGSLGEVFSIFTGFPQSRQDARELVLGAFGTEFAGGAARLNLYCKDLAGHAVLRATVEADYPATSVPDSATFVVDFEPAQLDEFLAQIKRFEATGYALLKG